MKKKLQLLIAFFILVSSISLFAEDITTASSFFDQVSAKYAEINDYIADISITRSETVMNAKVSYLKPDKVRMDFSNPANMTIVSDGKEFKAYLPQYQVILKQALFGGLSQNFTGAGLKLMRRNYSVSYLETADPVPLEEGSSEYVTKLLLTWRNINNGFYKLIVSVGKNMMIRRIEGWPINSPMIIFDYTNIRINTDSVPVKRFDYEAPGSASVYDEFIYSTKE